MGSQVPLSVSVLRMGVIFFHLSPPASTGPVLVLVRMRRVLGNGSLVREPLGRALTRGGGRRWPVTS